MKEQGRSTLSPEATGQILDRLSGLEKVISPEVMRCVLRDTGRVNQRSCPLAHEVMLWVVLAMGLLTHLPIRQVFRHARRWRDGVKIPVRSSLCEARQRLGVNGWASNRCENCLRGSCDRWRRRTHREPSLAGLDGWASTAC